MSKILVVRFGQWVLPSLPFLLLTSPEDGLKRANEHLFYESVNQHSSQCVCSLSEVTSDIRTFLPSLLPLY